MNTLNNTLVKKEIPAETIAYTAYPSLTRMAIEKDLLTPLRYWYILQLVSADEDGGIPKGRAVRETGGIIKIFPRCIYYILNRHRDTLWFEDGPRAGRKIYSVPLEEACRFLGLNTVPMAEQRPLAEIQGPMKKVVGRLAELYGVPLGSSREAATQRKGNERLNDRGLQPLLNVTAAAELLRMPETELLALAALGDVPGFIISLVEDSNRVASQLRFDRAELLDWARRRRMLEEIKKLILRDLGPDALNRVQEGLRSALLSPHGHFGIRL